MSGCLLQKLRVSNDGCLSSLKNHNHWEDDCDLPKVTHVIDMSAFGCKYLSYFGAVELVYSVFTFDLFKTQSDSAMSSPLH